MDALILGLTIGMANGLLAAGLVLIYMSNRTINLAHGELGAFAVAMMLALTRVAHLNYWLALACSLAAAALLGAIIETSFIRRLAASPRLIVLIATIGIAQLVIVARLILPKPRTPDGQLLLAAGGRIFPVPFDGPVVAVGRIVMRPEHFMILVAGPLMALGLFAFLRWSTYGVALRAAAQNAPRALLLGIPVRRTSTIAWVVASLLSGVAAILLAPVIGYSPTEAVGLPILMRGLAAAIVGRMESVGVAFAAGLGIGIVDQWVFLTTGRSGLTDAVLLGVILVALLARRRAGSRERESWEMADPIRSLPREVARHPRWTLFGIWAAMVGLIVVIVAPFALTPSATLFIATVLFVAAVGVSITVLTGWAGQLSIGQWALAGVGGVFGAKLVGDLGWPFWLGLLAAAVAGGLVALVLGLPALRLETTALAVVTLGFAVASASWIFQQPWFRGTGFLVRPSWITTRAYYLLGLAFLAAVTFSARRLQRSRVWRRMVAARDNPDQAAAFGVSIVRAKLTAFVVSGVIAASAGYLWAAGIGLADSTVFPPVRSLSIVAAVVIGGLGSIAGAVIGAFYLMAIPYFGSQITPYIGLISTGVGLLALVMFLPGGLVRVVFGARDVLAAWLTGLEVRPQVLRDAPDEVLGGQVEGLGEDESGGSEQPGPLVELASNDADAAGEVRE